MCLSRFHRVLDVALMDIVRAATTPMTTTNTTVEGDNGAAETGRGELGRDSCRAWAGQ